VVEALSTVSATTVLVVHCSELEMEDAGDPDRGEGAAPTDGLQRGEGAAPTVGHL
jgi:hypothetical protein